MSDPATPSGAPAGCGPSRPPGRLLGVDYGGRRIGLAICDPLCSIASPLMTVEAGGGDQAAARAVLRAVEGFQPAAIVLGLPLNMDGTEGAQARATRRFGQVLAGCSGLPLYLWDERLSSAAAEDALRGAELSRRKRRSRVDRVAAQMILQGFLDAGAWRREADYMPD